MHTRQTILVTLAIILIGSLAVWWYFGFTLDFMRFFAAEPVVTNIVTDRTPPPGCYYQEVKCIQAPCDPVLVCPSCQPRPTCLDATPSCDIAEPADGWCERSSGARVACAPLTQTVRVGGSALLTATGGNGAYEWFSPQGNPTQNTPSSTIRMNTYSVSYSLAGTKKITAQSLRGGGSADIDSVACTVIVTE